MIDIKVNAENLEEVKTYLQNIAEDSFPETKSLFQTAAIAMSNQVKDNTKNILKVRSGNLRRSIGQSVTGTSLEKLSGSLFSKSSVNGQELKYAPIHEFGGTVRAIDKYQRVQGGPYLNIPTEANKYPSGVTRMQAREIFNSGGYIVGKGVYLNGKKMFSLIKQAKIPARLGMIKAADDEVETLLGKLADAFGEN
jgi:phage gpG-like protein